MKKSKVLIPAMALLLFSTAASITGTVAWFTSTRVFETTIGEFELRQLDGNLECDLEPKFGVERKGAAGTADYNVLKQKSKYYLTDASFDESSETMYHISRDAVEPVGETPTTGYYDNRGTLTEKAKGTLETTKGDWVYEIITAEGANQGTYLLGFVWTMTFKYTFNAESGKIGVFLDPYKSVCNPGTLKKAATAEGKDSSKGFRIAFMEESGLDTVYAPLADGDAGALKHVNGTSSNNKTDYSETNNCLKTATGTPSLVEDGATDGANVSQICTITAVPATPTVAITKVVTCVAWYEGEDPNVVNGTAFYAPSVKLSFYSRKVA